MTRSTLSTAPPIRRGRVTASGSGNPTLMDAVHNKLRADIVSGRLAPGQKLPFELLRQRYAAGLAPIREALQRLTSEKLVTVEGHVGFKVAPMSLDDLVDINQLRIDLELKALRASVLHGDMGWEAGVVAAAHQLSRTAIPLTPDSPEAEHWEEQHRLFHDALIAACPSHWTLQFCRTLFEQFRRYRRVVLRRYWASHPIRKTIDAEHERLLKAVIGRNADKAVSLLEAHYANSAARVEAEFRQLEGAQAREISRTSPITKVLL